MSMTRKLLTLILIFSLSAGSLMAQSYFQYMGLDNASPRIPPDHWPWVATAWHWRKILLLA